MKVIEQLQDKETFLARQRALHRFHKRKFRWRDDDILEEISETNAKFNYTLEFKENNFCSLSLRNFKYIASASPSYDENGSMQDSICLYPSIEGQAVFENLGNNTRYYALNDDWDDKRENGANQYAEILKSLQVRFRPFINKESIEDTKGLVFFDGTTATIQLVIPSALFDEMTE